MSTDTADTTPASSTQQAAVQPSDIIGWLVDVTAFVVLGIWGFTQFAFPWPALLGGIGAPVLAILVWALFLSPRAVFGVDAFGRALVQIALFSAAALAMIFMGWPWFVAGAFVVVAAAAGLMSGRSQLRS
ncbi:MAG: YrdB family protein [Microbacteriaceae bacterium]